MLIFNQKSTKCSKHAKVELDHATPNIWSKS